MSATINLEMLPRLSSDEVTGWRNVIYGDARDDVRSVLCAGEDTADTLRLVEYALSTLNDESADAETRQAVMRASAHLLHESCGILQNVFDYLWRCASVCDI